jgi:hypothetical protein
MFSFFKKSSNTNAPTRHTFVRDPSGKYPENWYSLDALLKIPMDKQNMQWRDQVSEKLPYLVISTSGKIGKAPDGNDYMVAYMEQTHGTDYRHLVLTDIVTYLQGSRAGLVLFENLGSKQNVVSYLNKEIDYYAENGFFPKSGEVYQ